MAVEKKLIEKSLRNLRIEDFLRKELERAGVSSVVIQKTPIATRISITVRRPGIVVGKKGMAIKDLCDALQQEFGVENPQVEVIEVAAPSLDAALVAEKIGRQIEMKPKIKPIIRFALNDVMNAGAIGVEVRVAGKVVGKGAKAKTITARAGYLKKSGESMRLVDVGRHVIYLKAGAIGITVKIVRPGTKFSDKIVLPQPVPEPEIIEDTQSIEQARQVEEKQEEQQETKQEEKQEAKQEIKPGEQLEEKPETKHAKKHFVRKKVEEKTE